MINILAKMYSLCGHCFGVGIFFGINVVLKFGGVNIGSVVFLWKYVVDRSIKQGIGYSQLVNMHQRARFPNTGLLYQVVTFGVGADNVTEKLDGVIVVVF